MNGVSPYLSANLPPTQNCLSSSPTSPSSSKQHQQLSKAHAQPPKCRRLPLYITKNADKPLAMRAVQLLKLAIVDAINITQPHHNSALNSLVGNCGPSSREGGHTFTSSGSGSTFTASMNNGSNAFTVKSINMLPLGVALHRLLTR